jgi:hypothetical protein
MPESPKRAIRAGWRLVAAAGACAVAAGAGVAVAGGVDWSIGPLQLRVHQPWRLAGAGLLLLGASAWLGGSQFRAALERRWTERDAYAGWAAMAAAVATAAVGLFKGTWTAGSADSYGYVSQALLWLQGLPMHAEPLAAAAPWPLAEWSFAPLGYKPALDAGLIVPTYAPGLPLAMAAFAWAGGEAAVFWVVPVLGAAAVWLTYLLGRRYADAASGAGAAVLLAASPVFLYQLVQPMSDVPVTAWWLLSLWGIAAGLPAAAGCGAALALLTRPNLAPVAAVVMTAVVVHAYARRRQTGAGMRDAVVFAVPLGAAAAFLAWLNTRLYGSPLASGYGTASELFAMRHVSANAGHYARWLIETQSLVVLLGVAAPVVSLFGRRSAARVPSALHGWSGLGFAVLVAACYLPYSAFGEWSYLRFLLPALPVLLILTSWVLLWLVSAAPAPARVPLLCAGLAILCGFYLHTARERSAFDLQRLESRYVAAGAYAARNLPANAVLLSVQESGALRMYGRRTTVRFDHLDPKGLDAALQFFERTGHRPYLVLEAWEEAQFRDRFAGSSALGLLDWPPIAEVGRPVRVRFYDPRDRSRFLAGEQVATAREPFDDRGRR